MNYCKLFENLSKKAFSLANYSSKCKPRRECIDSKPCEEYLKTFYKFRRSNISKQKQKRFIADDDHPDCLWSKKRRRK